ncbi:pentapeptide repeat-containing protein [Paenibacillus roseipurpureus]
MKSDFYEATLQKVYYDECQLDQSQFTGAKLEGIDLSTCEFTSLGVSIEDLRGCIISRAQASVFVSLFGITLKE